MAARSFPWVFFSVVAMVLAAGAVMLVKVPPEPERANPPPPSNFGLMRVQQSAGDPVTAEKLAAYDPTPLFLPTKYSNSQRELRIESDGRAGVPFDTLKPTLKFSEESVVLDFPTTVAVPVAPVESLTLTERGETPLEIGRADPPVAALPARLGFVEAVATATGQVALSLALPPAAGIPGDDWQPLEAVGAVNRAGLVGRLVVVKSSGSERVDEFLLDHLRRVTQLGARLRPGIYAFRIGP